jgi:hypothetical protein
MIIKAGLSAITACMRAPSRCRKHNTKQQVVHEHGRNNREHAMHNRVRVPGKGTRCQHQLDDIHSSQRDNKTHVAQNAVAATATRRLVSTTNAGSSLAHWFFVSVAGTSGAEGYESTVQGWHV